MKRNQLSDMSGTELKRRIEDAIGSQAAAARKIGVKPQHLHRVIFKKDVSDRVLRAVAEIIGVDIKRVCPSAYLYGRPRRPGRPKSY